MKTNMTYQNLKQLSNHMQKFLISKSVNSFVYMQNEDEYDFDSGKGSSSESDLKQSVKICICLF